MISASDIASEERLAWISSMKINDFSVRCRSRRATWHGYRLGKSMISALDIGTEEQLAMDIVGENQWLQRQI